MISHILRETEASEQDEDDGSVLRIETGHNLKGTYYNKEGTGITFTVELQYAINSVAIAGMALASSAALLAF